MHEKVLIQELSKEQYLFTMDTSMRFIDDGDTSYEPFPIGEYVKELIKTLALPTTIDDIEIHAIYMNDKKGYVHILFNWGVKNAFLVLITKPKEKEIYGYHLLRPCYGSGGACRGRGRNVQSCYMASYGLCQG